MRILAVDDQPVILRSITHNLKKQGFHIDTANSGVEAILKLDRDIYDLLIVDLMMPDIDGFRVIEHVRETKMLSMPIIVMSGLDQEDQIVRAFQVGADDYIQKPVGIKEVLIRVLRLLKLPIRRYSELDAVNEGNVIHKNVTAVVIPCYNEENRLRSEEFQAFISGNDGYKLCFVNDGSKDGTLEVLYELRKGHEQTISVLDLEQNSGKAEAVRQGVLFMIEDTELDYIGFLDADLSTNFEDFEDLVNTISESENQFEIVSGSRISRVGANITKESSRQFISKIINKIIVSIIGIPFNDTQCGAKVFTRGTARHVFEDPFYTSWLFDVEIFKRFKLKHGKSSASMLYEQPLKRWVHEEGSKLSFKDSIKIVFQLLEIKMKY